ncbi:MAG: hypothetical protein JO363_09355 [Solirubrobacterales bacterium]|nr:hypothetical protein [Solirubrobacterales bacterium]
MDTVSSTSSSSVRATRRFSGSQRNGSARRLEFLRFSRRIVTLFAAGLATYVAFPAAPPWMAANMGLLHGVVRTTSDGWQVIGGRTVELFDEGQATVNLVAAVP